MSATVSQFQLDLRAFAAKAREGAGDVITKTVIDVGAHVVEKTPVGNPSEWENPNAAPEGYVGGRARANWQYGLNNAPAGTLDKIDTSDKGRRTAGELEVDVLTVGQPFGVHYIVNNLPYIRRLEFDAWSKQAPAGMVGITVIKFREFIAKNIEDVKK